ncbi:MAG: Ppx/GppA family phosphatase [Geodermatophilaceae bacterium]|nr:Ppx/GppA family phosphatase [Geodermatophilaceae bacterium]
MRLGVLDVGSNTVHLLVVDAHRGGHPMPTHSEKTVLRLAEHVDARGNLSSGGAKALVDAVEAARRAAKELHCDDMLAFATSAVRDARNSASVLDRVKARTGVQLGVLSGQDEARLTFLAVRRWFGWSAGRLTCLDIGGGSLELANGMDEEPDIAISLPLGAGRLTRAYVPSGSSGSPARPAVQAMRTHVGELLADAAPKILAAGRPDRAVATSKTLRTLARLTGAAPSKEGPRVLRLLTLTALRQLIEFVSRIDPGELSEIDGVSAGRAHQLLAGAIVAETTMEALGLEVVEICPWALREGVILRRLDWLDGA